MRIYPKWVDKLAAESVGPGWHRPYQRHALGLTWVFVCLAAAGLIVGVVLALVTALT